MCVCNIFHRACRYYTNTSVDQYVSNSIIIVIIELIICPFLHKCCLVIQMSDKEINFLEFLDMKLIMKTVCKFCELGLTELNVTKLKLIFH